MNYELLADRVRFFKERKEGVLIMCKAMEDMRNQSLREGLEIGRKQGLQEGMEKGVIKGRAEVALRMLKLGKYTLDEISALSELSVEEVKGLRDMKH